MNSPFYTFACSHGKCNSCVKVVEVIEDDFSADAECNCICHESKETQETMYPEYTVSY